MVGERLATPDLAVANLHCRVDCVAYHAMINSVSEKSELIKAAIGLLK